MMRIHPCLTPRATLGLAAWFVLLAGALTGIVPAQEATTPAGIESEGPAQLLHRGRTAFESNDFATAEEALEKFIVDYGAAEEAKEAARLHRPLVAIAKVGLHKFGEALEWIDQSREDPELDPNLADELAFWRGICLMTLGELVDAQRAFGAYWANESHQPFKRYEALLLFATLYLPQDFPEVTADFLADQIPKFREIAPEAASRGIVLQLYARLQAGQRREALDLIRAEFPNLGQMTQMISFQTLALQLGSSFLENEEWYEAISCLQRIWPEDRLVEYQLAKIQEIEDRVALLEARPNTVGTVHQLEAILGRVNRELESFRQIENFDSALRLRLATAFQQLGRYREAALIMEEMLESMPPDEIVESATYSQLQCWMEIRRWPRAVAAARRYEEAFGEQGRYLPAVLFLRAEALREEEQYGEAQLAYGKVVERFPEDETAAKALFMQGFLYLQQDDTDGALFQFDQVERQYPGSGMVEDADYWTGMAFSFSGLYEEAREHLAGYLERYPTPRYRKEAVFRIAVCTFSLAEYVESIRLLESFNETYPGDPLTDEANLLIGDAHFADGSMEEGFAAYERVRPESGRYFEEAWFKKGNAYKLLEEFDTMRLHFEQFVETYPGSARMPEAVYWVGWTWIQDGREENAREIYWQTIDAHGDDPDMETITEVLAALPRVYQGEGDEGRAEVLFRLESLKRRAAREGKEVLASRAGWAKAMAVASSNPLAARTELLDIAKWIDPKINSPTISVPVAEALLEAGNPLTAREMFTEIRRWNPRAIQKDRIYRALGDLAAEDGEADEAIRFYERFERETFASVHLGEVKLKKAELLSDRGRLGEARAEWEELLDLDGVSASFKAAALHALGESFVAQGDYRRAVVYFERIYIAYGKFSELNAKAYWQRGLALEKLGLRREALETWEELLAREDLKGFEETGKAAEKAVRLRREFPAEQPVEEPGEEAGK